jgi:hypothetical protein
MIIFDLSAGRSYPIDWRAASVGKEKKRRAETRVALPEIDSQYLRRYDGD